MPDLRQWSDHGFTEAQSEALADFESSTPSVDPSGHLTTTANAGVVIIDGGNANG